MEIGALDDYLVWELSRKTVQEALERLPLPRDRISGSMALARELIAGFSVEVKMKMVELFSPFSRRVDLLREKRWSVSEYPVSSLGTVLPAVGDLPVEEIVKSFVQVANFVRQAESGSSGLRSVRYIRSLSRVADMVEAIPIMVILPGSEQRNPDALKVCGNEGLSIFPADGYIEDGNHRALALLFSNPHRSSIRCSVGR